MAKNNNILTNAVVGVAGFLLGKKMATCTPPKPMVTDTLNNMYVGLNNGSQQIRMPVYIITGNGKTQISAREYEDIIVNRKTLVLVSQQVLDNYTTTENNN